MIVLAFKTSVVGEFSSQPCLITRGYIVKHHGGKKNRVNDGLLDGGNIALSVWVGDVQLISGDKSEIYGRKLRLSNKG